MPRFHRQTGFISIRAHLLMLVLAMAVPLALVVVRDTIAHRQEAVAHAKAALRQQASSMTRNASVMLADARDVLEKLAQRPLVQAMDPARCDSALVSMHSMLSGFTAIITVSPDGELVCSTRGLPADKPRSAFNSKHREWFQTALRVQRFSVGMPVAGAQTGKLISVISLPVHGADGAFVGVVALTLDLKKFDPNIADESLPEGSRYGFFAEDGTLLWRNTDPENVIGKQPAPETFKRMWAVQDGELEAVGVDGVERYFSVRPMPGLGWLAWVGVPAGSIHAEPNRKALLSIAGNSVAIGLLLWLAIALAQRISRPVQRLERAARSVGEGALDVRVELAGPHEIATVAGTFNEMAGALERNAEQLRIAAAAFDVHAPMVITDAHGVIVRMNATAQEVTGYSEAEAIGHTPRLFKSERHPPEFYANLWRAITSEGVWHGEIWDRRKDGVDYPALLTITAVRDASQAITHFIGVQIEISERKRYEETVYHMAFHDGLTHLPNRRLLVDRLEHALLACRREGGHGAVLFLDLDNFKPLNDLHGHEYGDLLLIEAARRLCACVREVDTVARLGGDEFVVVLGGLAQEAATALAEASTVAQKIQAALAAPYALTLQRASTTEQSVQHQCTASIGIGLFDGMTASAAEALKRADAAMYSAKHAGRNQIKVAEGS